MIDLLTSSCKVSESILNTTLDILPIYIQTIQYNNVRGLNEDSVNYSKSNNTTGWQEKVKIILGCSTNTHYVNARENRRRNQDNTGETCNIGDKTQKEDNQNRQHKTEKLK
jgi:carbohydrate-binding DOMON domain-containing protein